MQDKIPDLQPIVTIPIVINFVICHSNVLQIATNNSKSVGLITEIAIRVNLKYVSSHLMKLSTCINLLGKLIIKNTLN